MFSVFCLVILTVFVIIELQAARKKKNILTIYNWCINNCDDPGKTHVEYWGQIIDDLGQDWGH